MVQVHIYIHIHLLAIHQSYVVHDVFACGFRDITKALTLTALAEVPAFGFCWFNGGNLGGLIDADIGNNMDQLT